MQNRDLYQNTLKSNFVFGGIKLFQIIISLIRTKVVAIILGPNGIGIQSLFTSTLDSLQQFTTFGIFQSSVRDISKVSTSEDVDKIKVIRVVKTLVLITGALGFISCIIFSKILSNLVFGNSDFTISFIVLSVSLIFMSLSNGYITIFQGLRKLTELAKGSLIGAFISLIISIPLYYFWGVKVIPFVIVISYIVVFLVFKFYANKFYFLKNTHAVNIDELKAIGFPIIKLGSILMLSNGIMTLFTLALNAFINNRGGTVEVGLFNATFTATYGNIIILTSILSSDYYPRISGTLDNHKMLGDIVNQQIELLVLIVAPLICAIIPFSYYIILILYSSEFISISPIIQLMSLSLIFKVLWHALSYVILAFGDKKTYLIYDAILGNGLIFILNIVGYLYFGLIGVGVSFVIGSVIMVVLLYTVVKIKYNIKLSNEFWIIFSIMLTLCLLSFLISASIKHTTVKWVLEILILLLTLVFSTYIFNKRMKLLRHIKSMLIHIYKHYTN